MQALMEVFFPDGREVMDEDRDEDNMGMVRGEDGGQEDGTGENGNEQVGNGEQTASTGGNQAVATTSAKPREPTVHGALDNAAVLNQTDIQNSKSTKAMLLKVLMLALGSWVLISNWTLRRVGFDEIMCSWFDAC